jgi:NSS family neurotransmitter:Na+ symporter
MLADLAVSMLAGIAIFPAVFAFGFKPEAGPSLVFITVPAVFASMPAGAVFMFAFFVLTAVAATGAMLSIVEVPVAVLAERLGLARRTATVATLAAIALLGVLPALSQGAAGQWKFAGMNAFDLFDYLTSNLLLPAGGILVCVFTGWFWGRERVGVELSNRGTLENGAVRRALVFLVRWVSPVLIAVVMLRGFGVV